MATVLTFYQATQLIFQVWSFSVCGTEWDLWIDGYSKRVLKRSVILPAACVMTMTCIFEAFSNIQVWETVLLAVVVRDVYLV